MTKQTSLVSAMVETAAGCRYVRGYQVAVQTFETDETGRTVAMGPFERFPADRGLSADEARELQASIEAAA